MKKRLMTIISCLLVSSLSLTGCSSSANKAKTSSESNEKTVIEFWHVNAENFGAPVFHEAIKDFETKQSNIVVKERYNPNMYKGLMQNLQAEVASGKNPAIVMIGYNYLKYFAANFDYVTPEEIVNKYFPEDKKYLSDNFLENVLELAKVDGKQVGMPYAISTPVLFYNADMFKAAGLDPESPPETWNDVKNISKTIKDKTGQYGFYMQEYADNWAIQGLLQSNGANILSEKDGKYTASFASKESNDAYQLLADMVLKDKSALHITADEGIGSFTTGKVAMLYSTSAKRESIQKAAKFNLKAAPSPLFDGKERKIPAGGNFLAIMAKDEKGQKAAWLFIKQLLEPAWLAQWTKGTGYIPPRKGVAEDPNGLKSYLEENKLMSTAINEMPNINPWVSFPDNVGMQAEQIFANTRDTILGGNKDVNSALLEAQTKINSLLK